MEEEFRLRKHASVKTASASAENSFLVSLRWLCNRNLFRLNDVGVGGKMLQHEKIGRVVSARLGPD